MESKAFHSYRSSSHAEWVVTEPIVAFAFIWWQIQFKIVIIYITEKRGAGCWEKLIHVTFKSPGVWISFFRGMIHIAVTPCWMK